MDQKEAVSIMIDSHGKRKLSIEWIKWQQKDVASSVGLKEKVGIVVKGQQKGICGDGTVQYLDCGGDV